MASYTHLRLAISKREAEISTIVIDLKYFRSVAAVKNSKFLAVPPPTSTQTMSPDFFKGIDSIKAERACKRFSLKAS